MFEGMCCWLGPGVEHTCVDGIPCEPGQEEATRKAARQAAARSERSRAARAEGRLLSDPDPDEVRKPDAGAPWRPPTRPRLPRIGPPPLPTPGSELMSRLETAKPSDAFEWGEQARGWEAISRHAQAMAAKAITGLDHALAAQDEAMDVPPAVRDADAVIDEVARLTQCSAITAGKRVRTARTLATHLPQTWAALASARTSWGATLGLVDVTDGLSVAQAALVEDGLWPAKHDHTPGQVLARARTLMAKHAPEVLDAKAEAAAARREARRFHDPAGGSSVVELEGPAEEIEAFWADVATLVKRSPSAAPLPEQRLDAIFGAVREAADGKRLEPGFSRTAAARRGVVHVTVDLDTLLGTADNPGHISGVGPVTATRARQSAVGLIDDGAMIHRVTVDPDTGVAVAVDVLTPSPLAQSLRDRLAAIASAASTTPRPQDPSSTHVSADLDRRIVARDVHCVDPTCPLPHVDCDRDHREPHAQGGETSEANIDLRCRTHHRYKQHPAVTVQRIQTLIRRSQVPVTITISRTGHTWTSRPPDLRE